MDGNMCVCVRSTLLESMRQRARDNLLVQPNNSVCHASR